MNGRIGCLSSFLKFSLLPFFLLSMTTPFITASSSIFSAMTTPTSVWVGKVSRLQLRRSSNRSSPRQTNVFYSGQPFAPPSRSRYPFVTTAKQSSSSGDNYFTAATAIASISSTSSLNINQSDQTFPKWWPYASSAQNYISFQDHIAHVIVPNIPIDRTDQGTSSVLNCEEVVRWVLYEAAVRRSDINILAQDSRNDSLDEKRRSRILSEWKEGEDISTTSSVLDPAYRHDPSCFPQRKVHLKNYLIPAELLALGSVWHLPFSTTSAVIDRFDPSNGVKPIRLNAGDWNKPVHEGDYFRVHFDPRRFVETNIWDWKGPDSVICETMVSTPGVIVERDDEAGYIVINKPLGVPVHARVDNVLENVASSIGRMLCSERRSDIFQGHCADASNVTTNMSAPHFTDESTNNARSQRRQTIEPLVYVGTPQRLDQNTSGLLVVATKKSFAAYFSKLLRSKTSGQLRSWGGTKETDMTTHPEVNSSCGIHKSYRCLVCFMESSRSMTNEVETLRTYVREGSVIRHYLEPSIRAPKRFFSKVPDTVENPDCKPAQCIGIAEVEVELLTGRTHQIRGQFAALGFPLVGDAQYGGAIPCSCTPSSQGEKLALQCSSLEFLNPSPVDYSSGSAKVGRSERWKSFRLDHAFWTQPVLDAFRESSTTHHLEATSCFTDEGQFSRHSLDRSQRNIRLPHRVSLSRGRNKYVIVEAAPDGFGCESLLFVKSASPHECGGPNHANVANELLFKLRGSGYTATVIGGGRIDSMEIDGVSRAHVYGFSYGFGKGDHKTVASLIELYTDTIATFDDRDGIY